MAIANFIPQVWSARLQENLHKALVFGSLCNRNYEGEIAQWGDTVHISALNDITVKPYDPATEIEDPEQLSGTDITLTIDHGAYYNFFINDADAAQARVDLMDAAMRNAAYRLAADAEAYIISTLRENAGVSLNRNLPTPNTNTAYDLLLEIKASMDFNNVPRHDRKVVMPPIMESLLLMDNRFITASSGTAESLKEGAVARALGFDIYISNDLTNEIIALIPDAVTFAHQITKVDAYRPEKGFSDGLKGLCLSGAKVLIPEAVCLCTLETE